MTPSTFAAILEDRLRLIEDAVALIEKGDGDRPELDSLRGHLIDIWTSSTAIRESRPPRMIFTRLPPERCQGALASVNRSRERAALSEKRRCG